VGTFSLGYFWNNILKEVNQKIIRLDFLEINIDDFSLKQFWASKHERNLGIKELCSFQVF